MAAKRGFRGLRAVMAAAILAAALSGLPVPVPAQSDGVQPIRPLQLSLPIRCRPGDNCWLVNLVDLDPGPGRRDYLCGVRTYDGHKGTDIAIRDSGAMARGVAVLASARGRVKAVRDGMEDADPSKPGAPDIEGRDCGNGVVIDHGGGWETQYCHMLKGTVAVSHRQRVVQGQKLGLVGQSGRAEFPHVHLSVRYRDQVVDPFKGAGPGTGKGAETGAGKDAGTKAACGLGAAPLWQPKTLGKLRRPITALYNAGFATGPVKPDQARRGGLKEDKFPVNAPALVLWVDIFWVDAGDKLTLRILGPKDEVVSENSVTLEKTQARYFRFAGVKRKASRWPRGTYKGEIRLSRGGEKEWHTQTSRRVSIR